MKKIISHPDNEAFRNAADKYAAYLETPEGRLRVDLGFANLQEFLPRASHGLHALDLGGGTGALAMRLAERGFHVTCLDTSLEMLDLAETAALTAGFADRITLKHGDADQLKTLFEGVRFDVILCHNVLEFVSNPSALLFNAARILRDSSSIISILVRNRAGEVLKAALINGDLAAAEHNLTAEWADESLYGGKVRLFTEENIRAILATASLVPIGELGVRVVSDYLPPTVSRDAEYEPIFDLECKLGRRSEFAPIARYTQFVAHPAGSVLKDEV